MATRIMNAIRNYLLSIPTPQFRTVSYNKWLYTSFTIGRYTLVAKRFWHGVGSNHEIGCSAYWAGPFCLEVYNR